jgi:hypothetical protein
MAEIKKTEVKTFESKLICPNCKIDMTFYQSIGTLQHLHICNKCGYKEIMSIIYPVITYEKITVIPVVKNDKSNDTDNKAPDSKD